MRTRRETEAILNELSAAQHGRAARSQLVARGLSASAVDRLIRVGRVTVVRPGVYQVGPQPLPHGPEVSAVLACGPDSRVSHCSAARLHEIVEEIPRAFVGAIRSARARNRTSRKVEVTVPRNNRRRIDGVRIHRVRDLREDEVTEIHGIPVTTPARTLLDIAEDMTPREVEQAYATALRRGLVTPAMMNEMVERHPRHRGAALWRRLLAQATEPVFTRSQAEERLLELIRSARLPPPEVNTTVLGHEVDFVWHTARLVAEVDGYAWHASPRSFAADRNRDAELAAAGYRVVRFTWADLVERRSVTLVRLAQALVRGS